MATACIAQSNAAGRREFQAEARGHEVLRVRLVSGPPVSAPPIVIVQRVAPVISPLTTC